MSVKTTQEDIFVSIGGNHRKKIQHEFVCDNNTYKLFFFFLSLNKKRNKEKQTNEEKEVIIFIISGICVRLSNV